MNPDASGISTTFFTAVTRGYWPFVAPYAASTLVHNQDVRMELCVEDLPGFIVTHERVLRRLAYHFPGRLHLRTGKFRKRVADAVRFLETPEEITEFTYIGDADMLILEGNIAAQHIAHMARIGLPYSNVLREGDPHKLSGLHFTRSDAHYPLKIPNGLDLHQHCENTLQALVLAKGLPLPGPEVLWRPQHGIHLSLNRRPVDTGRPHWGIRSVQIDAYLALWENPAWRDIAQDFHPAYCGLLQTLEAVMQALRPAEPIYRYEDARRRFIAAASLPW
jgi:hypothetical protein